MLRFFAALFAVGRVRSAPELWCRGQIILALRNRGAGHGRMALWHA
jgi:hypothetical protein